MITRELKQGLKEEIDKTKAWFNEMEKTYKVYTFMETLLVSECINKEHAIQKVEKYLEGGFDSIWKVEEVI